MNGQGRQGLESCVDVRGFGRHKPLSERGEDVASRGDTNRGQLQEPAMFEFVDHAAGGQRFSVVRTGSASPSADKYAWVILWRLQSGCRQTRWRNQHRSDWGRRRP